MDLADELQIAQETAENQLHPCLPSPSPHWGDEDIQLASALFWNAADAVRKALLAEVDAGARPLTPNEHDELVSYFSTRLEALVAETAADAEERVAKKRRPLDDFFTWRKVLRAKRERVVALTHVFNPWPYIDVQDKGSALREQERHQDTAAAAATMNAALSEIDAVAAATAREDCYDGD